MNHKVEVLVGKRIFFITSKYELVSLLMDKAAIDRSNSIHNVHHKLDGMNSIWADENQVVWLNMKGNLDIVSYSTCNKKALTSNGSLKEIFFTFENLFRNKYNEAVSITGCTRYLAVSKHDTNSCISTIALLDRQGRFMSRVSDSGVLQLGWRDNPIHRMEFWSVKKCVLLVAQNL